MFSFFKKKETGPKVPTPQESARALDQLKLARRSIEQALENDNIVDIQGGLNTAEKALKAAYDLDKTAMFQSQLGDLPLRVDYDYLAGELVLHRATIAARELTQHLWIKEEIKDFAPLREKQQYYNKTKQLSKDAYAAVERSLKFHPGGLRSRLTLADIHITLDKKVEARTVLEAILADFPGDMDALRRLNAL